MAQVLHNNGYPRGLVTKNWHPIASTPCNLDQDAPTDIVIHPYRCHMSKTIRRILTPLGIRTCFWPHCTLRQTLVRVKDPTPPQCRAGVVYRIPCGMCPKVYIGQTGRMLELRLKEHKRALTSGNVSQLVVAKHAMDASHTIKWKEAEVNHHPCYRKRYALESWHIRTEQHKLKMNRNNGPLPPVYNPLVHLSHLQPPTDLVGHHLCYLCLFTLTQPSVFSNPIISVTSLLLCYFIDRF